MDESSWWPTWFPSTETHQHLSSPASKPAGHDLRPGSSPRRPHTVIRCVCVCRGRRGPHRPEAEPDLGAGSTVRASDIRALGSLSAFTLPPRVQPCAGLSGSGSSRGARVVLQRHLCPILVTVDVPFEEQMRENGGGFQTKLRARSASWAGEDVASDHLSHFLADRSQARTFPSWTSVFQSVKWR